MKAFLMFRARDFDVKREEPFNAEALVQDLGLNTLFEAMAAGDEFLFEVAKKAVLGAPENDTETIVYRQAILKDCLRNPEVVREIYALAVSAMQAERKIYLPIISHPSTVLRRSLEVLELFIGVLKSLRKIADQQAGRFESDGFTVFFAMLQKELGAEFFAKAQEHLADLKFRRGVLVSAELGLGNRGINYVLRRPNKKQNWKEWIFSAGEPSYTLYIAERDVGGARALAELEDRGTNLVANALAQSNDHILSFFSLLRAELAFYMGCLNLYERLSKRQEPVSFPLPVALLERQHSFRGLYDVSLALSMDGPVVGNDLDADDTDLVIITGANQGGKSTSLRGVGLAQLMMQSGMFVAAERYRATVCDGLFTHFKREEDVTMTSGKLDEELSRMSELVDHMTSNPLMLFNESFAATNEREGSEIARQIVSALLENRVRVFFVTHLYEFARAFYDHPGRHTIFLRAERESDGTRTFKLHKAEPLRTSFGEDLYHRIFDGNGEPISGQSGRHLQTENPPESGSAAGAAR